MFLIVCYVRNYEERIESHRYFMLEMVIHFEKKLFPHQHWENIKEEWPELMLLDIRMPVLDGLGLLEKLQEFTFEHRVMILSAFSEFEYAKRCMQFGVREYLLKPIDIREEKVIRSKYQ